MKIIKIKNRYFLSLLLMILSLTIMTNCSKIVKLDVKSKEASIISFELGTYKGKINGTSFIIELPYGLDISSLSAKVKLSEKATIKPNPKTVKDWSTPVWFTVTAENGKDSKKYKVEVKILPAVLTFQKLTKKYTKGGHLDATEILNHVKGEKSSYTLKEITNLNPNDIVKVNGIAPNLRLEFNRLGVFTALLRLKHNVTSDLDVTISNAAFEITRGSAPSLSWTKQTKAFSSGGEITNAHLLAGVTGSGKNGYTIKAVTITSADGTGATVSGSGTSAKITSYTKIGTLTLTIVLQHDTKDDVTITGATFEIYLDIFTISSGGEVTLKIGVDKNSLTTVTIPYMIDGSTVTSIARNAFSSCSSLTSVTIPNSVTSIGYGAFNDCISLTRITIPNSVTSIGHGAFYHCASLTSITIGNSVTSIGGSAFTRCTSLTSITIPNSVTSIGRYVFSSCRSLTSIMIGNSVTSIGRLAFYHCSSLTRITIPNSVKSIGNQAFFDCHSLTSITMGNSVTSIGYGAFSYCISLTSITMGNSVTSIGLRAFSYCSSLTSITMGNSVTSIGDLAFYKCSKLTSITIGNSVTSVGNQAFYECTSLISITIPNSVTTIGTEPFKGCIKLTTIRVPSAKVATWQANLKKGNTANVVGY